MPSAVAAQSELVEQFATRTDLQRSVIALSFNRISRVRRSTSFASLPTDELPGLARSALAFGVYRALIERFSLEQGLSHDWWVEQRRQHSRNGKDRQNDFDIILQAYPEFSSYIPSIPLTDDEVLKAAKVEFRDAIAAPGTSYHEQEVWTRRRRDGTSVSDSTFKVVSHDAKGRIGDYPDHLDIMDPDAHKRVENFFLTQLQEDDRHVLGPAMTRVTAIALSEYGPSGMFWLVEWLYLPKKYTELLRIMGQTEEEMGKQRFEAVKRDMVRKLPQVHARMMELLRNDPDILHLRELMVPLDHVHTTPSPRLPSAAAKEATETYRAERPRFIERKRKALFAAIEADPEVAEHIDVVRAFEQGPEMSALLQEFVRVNGDEARWGKFKQQLVKHLKVAA